MWDSCTTTDSHTTSAGVAATTDNCSRMIRLQNISARFVFVFCLHWKSGGGSVPGTYCGTLTTFRINLRPPHSRHQVPGIGIVRKHSHIRNLVAQNGIPVLLEMIRRRTAVVNSSNTRIQPRTRTTVETGSWIVAAPPQLSLYHNAQVGSTYVLRSTYTKDILYE